MPCVQQGLYSITVNNLPPNPGGYHLTYQVVARNLSLTNINSVCSCIGASFYAYIPGQPVIWGENFSLANGTITDGGATAWTRTLGPLSPNYTKVNGNHFEIAGANNAQTTWTSQNITISSCPSFDLKVDLSQAGALDATDSILVYYRLNGGPLTLFPVNGFKTGNFTPAIATATALAGSTIQIVIRV